MGEGEDACPLRYPMDLGVRTPVFPTIYGTYYPMVGNQYDKAQAKKFVIPRLSNLNIQQFPSRRSRRRL